MRDSSGGMASSSSRIDLSLRLPTPPRRTIMWSATPARRTARAPACPVEVYRRKSHRVVGEQRIAPNGEITPFGISPAKVHAHCIVVKGQQPAVWADGARNAFLVTDATSPFYRAYWGVSTFPRLRTHVPPSIDIFPTSKHRPKKANLLVWRRCHRHVHNGLLIPDIVRASQIGRNEKGIVRHPIAIAHNRLP